MRFKNGSPILPFLRYTTKTAHDIFLSWTYGGKKGIRTLEGFRGPTRFPVVRLRPAQPSFHFLCCIVDFSIHDQFCGNRGNTISCFCVPHDCLDIIPAIPEKVKCFFQRISDFFLKSCILPHFSLDFLGGYSVYRYF